jgi:pimeloyl-ACP methyl ester carboxylesterase
MAKGFSANYYKFAAKELVKWEPVKTTCPIVKIHGTKDELFPISKVNADYIVEGGGHLMIVNYSKEISEYLNQAIA